MQENETIIFREYRTTVDDAWVLADEMLKMVKQGGEEAKRSPEYIELDKQYKERNRKSDKQALEIKKDIIIPSLDANAGKEEIKTRFTEWCTTWAEYIDNMTDAEFVVFVTAENEYYDTEGKSREIENFRPSEIFTNEQKPAPVKTKSKPSMNM